MNSGNIFLAKSDQQFSIYELIYILIKIGSAVCILFSTRLKKSHDSASLCRSTEHIAKVSDVLKPSCTVHRVFSSVVRYKSISFPGVSHSALYMGLVTICHSVINWSTVDFPGRKQHWYVPIYAAQND